MTNESDTNENSAVPTPRLAIYEPIESGLATLREKYRGALYAVETPAGLKLAVEGRAELRALRIGIEKRRADAKAPLLEAGRALDSEAKRLTTEIAALEDPIDRQIRVEEGRRAAAKVEKERLERERLAAITVRIEAIRREPLACITASTSQIRGILASVQTIDPLSFDEVHRPAAIEAIASATAQIETALAARVAAEAEQARLAETAAAIDRQRAELAESERLAVLARADADRAAQAARDEADRLATAQRVERERVDAAEREARVEAERVTREKRLAEERAEDDRLAAERAERERVEEQDRRARAEAEAAERLDLERRRAELAAEEERVEADRLAAERAKRAEMVADVSLLDAARNALDLLVAHGFGDDLVTEMLSAAIARAEQMSEAA